MASGLPSVSTDDNAEVSGAHPAYWMPSNRQIEPGKMETRPATENDQAALFDLHEAVFRHHIEQLWGWDEGWQRANFAAELTSATTVVIEVDGRMAGYLQIRNEGERIYVLNIAISRAFQGKGIGTRLMKELQSTAAARKVPLQLGVFRTNASAQRLYERLGFQRTGETRTHIEMSWTAA